MNRKARRAAQKEAERRPAPRPQAAVPDPTPALAYCSLGWMRAAEGRFDEAIDAFVRAIELQGDLWDAHHGLCRCLMALGQYAPAVEHYERIVPLNPDALTFNNLAIARLGAGEPDAALEAVCRAISLGDLQESHAVFVICARKASALPDDPALRALMMRAISEPWGRPADLAAQCVKLVKADPAIGALIAEIESAWPRRLPAETLLSSPGFAALARDPLLQGLLANAPVSDLALERALTACRGALLDLAVAGREAGSDTLAFACALARQCFINEYVFELESVELQALDGWRASWAAMPGDGLADPALRLAVLAAYAPLSELGASDAILSRAWPAPLDAVVTQQIREPARERALREAIPALTPIEDMVSVAVRDQYEDNPYPRWVRAAPSSKAVPLNARLHSQYPHSGFRPLALSDRVEILVAGCGTGQQLVDVAQRIEGARVLAIDLSLSSIAYAKRKTDELGLDNIDYGQADILRLGALGRRFDVIDCGGVLHHLRDPLEGWRVLLSLLAPGGAMRIALYSELARKHIVAARDFVAGRGYAATPEGIRAFRRALLDAPDAGRAKLVAQSPDFFTISALRDLVFHVQEHRFTLPQIAAFLDEAGLTFLGFELDQSLLAQYSARFPEDRTRTDLARWHRFEEANPWTFGGMYQFWVQPRMQG
jgi:2-polyprenyl-3-methyl-5-hydroxy-6-metoxy-1,4-benzoquinol methylase